LAGDDLEEVEWEDEVEWEVVEDWEVMDDLEEEDWEPVETDVIVRAKLASLPWCCESPLYWPITITLPGTSPVNVNKHPPDARFHPDDGGKLTRPVPDWVRVTVPVGVDPPVTVIVHIVLDPTARVIESQLITAVVTV